MPLILRIILWACFFTLVFLTTTWLFNGCKSETAQALDDMEEVVEDTTDDMVKDVEENVKELSDKFFEDDDEIIYTNEDEEESDLANDLFQEADTEKVVVEKPAVRETKRETPAPVSTNTGGRFLVVAGNYLVETNAREMVKKLKNMGYSGAQHLVFDQSQYYTVIASRSDSRNGAQSSSDNLKGKGVDNYVHTQRN